MKLLNETNEIICSSELAAEQLAEEQARCDNWKSCSVSSLEVKAFECIPILLSSDEYVADLRKTKNVAPTVTKDSLRECMESNCLSLHVPHENEFECYPIGTTAFGSLIQRAGYQNSPVLLSLTDKNSQKPMNPEKKSTVLNFGLSCYKNKALVLIRDEKIRAVLSGDEADYTILPFNQLFAAFKEGLSKQFEEVDYLVATASHEYFSVLYSIYDKSVNDEMQKVFAGTHIDISGMTLACRLRSSDVGLSGANIYPYLRGYGREMMIGNPLVLTHKNKHSIEDFKANVMQVTSMFKEDTERLKKMQVERIHYPSGCLLRIAKQAGLSKKITCEEAPDFEATFGQSCTEADIYWELYDIYDRYCIEADLSESRKISIQEGITRCIFGNMKDYDIPFQWE